MAILLKNGKRLIDEEMKPSHVEIADGLINRIWDGALPQEAMDREDRYERVIDLGGKFISHGFIDMHVHLRDPGLTEKEDIPSGTKAAAAGGFTTVACMPNTKPAIDSPETVHYILGKTGREGAVRVIPMGAISTGQRGEQLTDMAALKKAGIIAVSDDGVGVQDSGVMLKAMKQAAALHLPVVAHCEDNTLINGGSLHQGTYADRYGLPGIPSQAEAVHIARDAVLAEAAGAHYHVCHISSAQSVQLVREAKARGVKITAEVCPHHLILCDEDIPAPDDGERVNTHYKMNPPLRSAADRDALIAGLLDGTIDIIVTDHAPHTEVEKARNLSEAPFGIVGLETAFPLLYTRLVMPGIFSLAQLIDWMTERPAALFHLPWGTLQEGRAADLTVLDLEKKRTVDPGLFYSKGKNTPFTGWNLQGWPVLTIVGGQIVFEELT